MTLTNKLPFKEYRRFLGTHFPPEFNPHPVILISRQRAYTIDIPNYITSLFLFIYFPKFVLSIQTSNFVEKIPEENQILFL